MSGTVQTPQTHEDLRIEIKQDVHIVVVCKSKASFHKFFDKLFGNGDEATNSESVERNVYNASNVKFYVVDNEEDYSMNCTCDCTLLLFSEPDKHHFMNMAAFGRKMMFPVMSVMMYLEKDAADTAASALLSVTNLDDQDYIFNVEDVAEVGDAVKKFDFSHLPSFTLSDDDDREIIKLFITGLLHSPSLCNPCKIYPITPTVEQNIAGCSSALVPHPAPESRYVITVPPWPDLAVLRRRIESGRAGIFVFLALGCTQFQLNGVTTILKTIAFENNATCSTCTTVEEACVLGLTFSRRIWVVTTCVRMATTYFEAIDQLREDPALHLPEDSDNDGCPRNLSKLEQMKMRRDNKAKKTAKSCVSSITGPASNPFDLSTLENAVVKPPSSKSKKKNKKNSKMFKKVPQVEDLSNDVPNPSDADVLPIVPELRSATSDGKEETAGTSVLVTPTVVLTAAESNTHPHAPEDASSFGANVRSHTLDSHRHTLNTSLPRPFVNWSPRPTINEQETKRQLEILRQAHNNFFFNPDGTPDEKVMTYVPPERRDNPLQYKMPLREYNERFGLPQPKFKPKPEEPKDIGVIDRTETHSRSAPDTARPSSGDKIAMKKHRPGKN